MSYLSEDTNRILAYEQIITWKGVVFYSVGSYVIPWESRVNSCHLRFSC